jgi:hypothetical protein
MKTLFSKKNMRLFILIQILFFFILHLFLNRETFEKKLLRLQDFSVAFMGEPRICLPILENTAHCINDISIDEGAVYLRSKNLKDIYFKELSGVSIGQTDEKIFNVSKNQIVSLMENCPGGGNTNQKCLGILIDNVDLLKALSGKFVTVQLKTESAGPVAVNFGFSSKTRIALQDSNGWDFFDKELHMAPGAGDLIFLNGKFSFEVNQTLKQPYVAHNRSIFRTVGAWPKEDDELEAFIFGNNSQANDILLDYPLNGKRLDIEGSSKGIFWPKYRRGMRAFITVVTPSGLPSKADELESFSLSISKLVINRKAWVMSGLAYDIVQGENGKNYCKTRDFKCLENLL